MNICITVFLNEQFYFGGFFWLGQKCMKFRQNLDTDPAHSLPAEFLDLESMVGWHSTNLESAREVLCGELIVRGWHAVLSL